MARAAAVAATPSRNWIESRSTAAQVALVIGASLLVAGCARLTLPLPFTPIPLTVQNLGVLLVGLLLGSRRGAAAMALYLAEGAAGLPVFSAGASGFSYLTGATFGYLVAYPAVAFLAGWIGERYPSFRGYLGAAFVAETLLFASGIGWLLAMGIPLKQAAAFGLYPFVFAEVIKVMVAAAVANRLRTAR